MFHARLLPLFSSLRERGLLAVLLMVGLFVAASPARAEKPRVASINVCTDQLLMALADPAQIVGLSPYSRDAARSWAAADAKKFPLLSGEAEDVLVLKPDVVVAGRFTKRATRELLKEKGLRVIEFDAARSIADVRSQILRMGDIIDQPARAKAEVGRLDDAISRATAMASRKTYSVLAVSRRGWVSGGDSLTSALLAEVGLSNAAGKLGLRSGGFASLETIVSLKPDLIFLSESGNFAEDQGRAFLLHPALEQLYPPEKRLVVPERLTVCGGPMLADALDRLTAELARIGR
jgi:iron complex transport system substrate-binding protein